MLLETTIKKRLNPGEYEIQIQKYREVTNTQGGYIELTIELPDRTIRQNFFKSNLDYLGKSLRDQLGIDADMNLKEILDKAVGKKLFGIISYNEYGLNLAFHKPRVQETEDVDFK